MGGAQGSSLIQNRVAGTCTYQTVLALAGHEGITASHFSILRESERRRGEHVVRSAHNPTGYGKTVNGKTGDKVSMGQQRPSLTGGGSQKAPLSLCWAHDRNTAAEATMCRMPGVGVG